MPKRHAICIVVDGLRASALGCYGNTWAATPGLDRIASQSIVMDWLWSDSPYLSDFYHSIWHGCPAWSTSNDDPPLPAALMQAGVEVTCVTDEPELTAISPEFERFRVVRAPPPNGRASLASETSISRVLETTTLHLAETLLGDKADDGKSKLCWVHARGMHGAWDAPIAEQAALLDVDDPSPMEILAPPERIETSDPDEMLAYRAAYAAQVSMLDIALTGMLSVLAEWRVARETLVILVGARGFALGEHGLIGRQCDDLFGEMLHVPCLANVVDWQAPRRCERLLQPFDLHGMLARWFGVCGNSELPDDITPVDELLGQLRGRDVAISRNRRGQQAMRTPAWLLIHRAAKSSAATGQCELFVKPDDRWEANEISSLRGEIVERLLALDSVDSWPPVGNLLAGQTDPALTQPER